VNRVRTLVVIGSAGVMLMLAGCFQTTKRPGSVATITGPGAPTPVASPIPLPTPTILPTDTIFRTSTPTPSHSRSRSHSD